VETFIVRIYRREPAPADEPVGTGECVGSGERQGFAGREELWERMSIAGSPAHERKAPHGTSEPES